MNVKLHTLSSLLWQQLIIFQAMALTSSVPIFVLVSRTSFSPSKSAYVVPNVGVLVLSFTSGRRDELLEKSPSISLLISVPLFALNLHPRYLVYNLRKRGGDTADKYFRATELIAGVKDMRFQALMPDVLHWLGIKKVDNMVSMSDM